MAVFQEALNNLIAEHWEEMTPSVLDAESDEEAETIEAMGATYPSAWTLIYTCKSVEFPEAAGTFWLPGPGQDIVTTTGQVRRAMLSIDD